MEKGIGICSLSLHHPPKPVLNLLLLAPFCAPIAAIQQKFPEHLLSISRSDLRDLQAVDFDGDSDWDLISSSASSGMAWHENLGDGQFDHHLVDSNNRETYHAEAKDLDSDGLTDLVFLEPTDLKWESKIYWVKNLGNGEFGEPESISN